MNVKILKVEKGRCSQTNRNALCLRIKIAGEDKERLVSVKGIDAILNSLDLAKLINSQDDQERV